MRSSPPVQASSVAVVHAATAVVDAATQLDSTAMNPVCDRTASHHIVTIPMIMVAWNSHQQEIFADLLSKGKPFRLSKYCQMDSPEFSEKYCIYSMLDMSSQKIVAFVVVNVTERKGKSTNMEFLGVERCLKRLLDHGFAIEIVVTDRHFQVRSLLSWQYSAIKNQFDMWHMAKWVKKKLLKVTNKKLNANLSSCSQLISNNLWWCASSCNRDEELLVTVRRQLSIISSIKARLQARYTKRAHPILMEDEQHRKKWLIPNSVH